MLFRFDKFLLDTELFELRRDGRRVEVQPKVLDLLAYLLASPGRVVPKDELRAALWPDVAVTMDALYQLVRAARRSLGVEGTRLIVTVRGRGYRIEVPVEVEDTASGRPKARSRPPARGAPGRRRSLLLAAYAGIAVLVWAAWALRAPVAARSLVPWSVASGSAAAVRLAVLPFADVSPEGDQGDLADGLAEEIAGQLAGVDDVDVTARATAFAFRRSGHDVRRIGSALGVDYVLEGSLWRDDDQVQVAVELVRASDGTDVWAETYESPGDDVVVLEQTTATAIVNGLRAEVGSDSPFAPNTGCQK